MYTDNDRIIMDILDSVGCLEIEEMEMLVANIECMIENKKEELEEEVKIWKILLEMRCILS